MYKVIIEVNGTVVHEYPQRFLNKKRAEAFANSQIRYTTVSRDCIKVKQTYK